MDKPGIFTRVPLERGFRRFGVLSKGRSCALKRKKKHAPRRSRPRRPAAAAGTSAEPSNLTEVLSHLSQAIAAWILGVSSRTLRELVDAPRQTDGTYDLRPLLAWWVEREKRKLPSGPSPAKERILEARAAAAERRNAIELGRLVDIESAAHTVRWSFGKFSARIAALIKAGGPIQPAELEAAIDQARSELEAAFGTRAPLPETPPSAPPMFPGGGLPDAAAR